MTKEEGLRVLEKPRPPRPAARTVVIDYAGESRQIRREGSALTVTLGFAVVLIYLVLAAQFQQLPRPADRAARVGAAGDLAARWSSASST